MGEGRRRHRGGFAAPGPGELLPVGCRGQRGAAREKAPFARMCMRVHACACLCMRVHACAWVCMRVHVHACARAAVPPCPVPAGLSKMHWSPEHAQSLNQWPEQHLDVSSTTSSPAHKPDLYPGGRQRFNYAWANDDISALTASNLLKRYAEKYAAALDAPYERPALGGYGDGAFGGLNGQKGDGEPWAAAAGPDGAYGLSAAHDGLAGAKAAGASGSAAAPPPALPEPVYGGGSCGSGGGGGGVGSPQEYGYGGAYLPSGYCGQAAAHAPAGLLPPASALVPGYAAAAAAAAAATAAAPGYGYAAGYAPQPGYGGVHPPHPAASYLPAAIAAPAPLPRPPAPPAYGGYQSPGPAPPPVADASLKRKAFDMAGGADEADGRYGKFGYEAAKAAPASPYGNGYGGGGAEPPQGPFKAPKAPGFGGPAGAEPPAAGDPLGLEPADGGKMVDGGPPVHWADIAGQASVKAALEEELVWPLLRPGAYAGAGRPPRTVLLFGPRGAGKTLLSRCVSTQLGSSLLKLSGAALLSKRKAEAEKILQTVFFVAGCRQPSVVLITEAEALLPARAGEDGGQAGALKSLLLSYLDNVATSAEHGVVVIGTTRRPGAMDEASHRRFAKRFYVSPPDGAARRQILQHALARRGCCLGEREMASLVQHTESYSGGELVQLCQRAGAGTGTAAGTAAGALPGQLPPPSYKELESALRKVRPAASAEELDLFVEWDKMYGSGH
ncbi:fidgetin-like protein 2 [Rhea pennata]|uniref:fidgetin-like protein 2 n=1 Tax=Rhea pennata TaxID=8795 RepID=UPI002E2650CB